MSQTQNLSSRNALARLTMGLSMLAYGAAKLSRNPKDNKGRLMVALGAMKAAEGTTKFCPMKAMMQQNGMSGSTSTSQVGQFVQDFANKGMGLATGGTGGGMSAVAGMAATGAQAMAGMGAGGNMTNAGAGAGGNQGSAGAGAGAGGNQTNAGAGGNQTNAGAGGNMASAAMGAGGNTPSAGMGAGGKTGAQGIGKAANMANAAANAGSGGSGSSSDSAANNKGQVKKIGNIKKAVWSSS